MTLEMCTTVCFFILNSLLIFAVWERTDNKIGSRGRRRPRGWAVQSPPGENVRQTSRSNRKYFFYSESCWSATTHRWKIHQFCLIGNSHWIAFKILQRSLWLCFWRSPQGAWRTSNCEQPLINRKLWSQTTAKNCFNGQTDKLDGPSR